MLVSIYRAVLNVSSNDLEDRKKYQDVHEGTIPEINAVVAKFGTDGVTPDEVVLHSMTMTFLKQKTRK